MINFATLQGLSIPEGVVTQITDASGRVIWAVGGGKVILEVEKITSNTYAGETLYENEEFVLLDIYPKTNGTVKVTYGGLTKTITDTSGAAEPNAQQVFFGTFNGVSDSVATPTSGELTIEGDYYAFGGGAYKKSSNTKGATTIIGLRVISVVDFGDIEIIPSFAFSGMIDGDPQSLAQDIEIPEKVRTIGDYSFNGRGLKSVVIGNTLEYIGWCAFFACQSLSNVTIGSGIKELDSGVFSACASLQRVTIFATTPPTLKPNGEEYQTFKDCSSLTSIIVPKGCGNAYKTAEGWINYADYIVEAS
jgi:hypothetical protein